MNGSNTKRIILVFLLILTLGLGVLAIYVGYTLSKEDSQAPDDTSAAACEDTPGCYTCGSDGSCNACCIEGASCDTPGEWTEGWNKCNGNTDACRVIEVSADKTTFTISAACSNVKVEFFEKEYTGTSTKFYPNCEVVAGPGVTYRTETVSGQQTFNSYKQGKCQQIDALGGGVCRCEPPAAKKACNTSCTRNADCETGYCNTTAGKCRNSKCPNDIDCTCPPTVASCGDGIKNQTSEECEVGVACADANQVCDEAACTCSDIPSECGDTCETDSDCPDSTFCNGDATTNEDYPDKTCVLNACTESSNCTSDGCGFDYTACSESCTSDLDCTDSGNVCNGDSIADSRYPDGTCILESCTATGASCSSNGCQPSELPRTAIIDDQSDAILGAIIAILTGILLIKFDVKGIAIRRFNKIRQGLQSGKLAYITAPVSSKARKKVTDSKKEKFEDKIVK